MSVKEAALTLTLGVEIRGFGEYDLPNNTTFNEFIDSQKTYDIAMAIFFGASGAVVVVITVIVVAKAAFLIPVVATVGIFAFVFFAIKSVEHITNCYVQNQQYPPTQQLNFHSKTRPGVVSSAPVSVQTLENGTIANSQKLQLMQEAKESIVLCGCYCGGEVFDQALDIIQGKIENLKEVYIISNGLFFTPSNRQKIQALSSKYPNIFSCVTFLEFGLQQRSIEEGDWMVRRLHVKGLVIDYGRKAIVGGSGFADYWSRRVEGTRLVAKQQQDMDHLYTSSQGGIGEALYFEVLKLFAMLKFPEDPQIYSRLSRRPITELSENTVESNAKCKILLSSPLHQNNSLLDEVISLVGRSQKTIYISNMYFHPTPGLFSALVAAAKRRVKIILLTNANRADSPHSHAYFGATNQKYCYDLLKATNDVVEVFEYSAESETLHTKVFIFDGVITINGSHNLGYRSMEGLLDEELSIAIESEEVAEKTLKGLQIYQKNAERMTSSSYPQTIQQAVAVGFQIPAQYFL